jgi:hypothetical protein
MRPVVVVRAASDRCCTKDEIVRFACSRASAAVAMAIQKGALESKDLGQLLR